jgi:hypothetical protein
MTILLSDLMQNGALPLQANASGDGNMWTAIVKVPAGYAIPDNTVVKLARIDADVFVDEIVVRSDDIDSNGAPTASASIGYVRPVRDPSKDYNASTNPTVTGGVAADSAPFTTGGTARYVAGQTGLDNEFAVGANGANGVADIIDLALTFTEPAATGPAADSYIRVQFRLVGKNATPGTFSGETAYRYKTAYPIS